MFEQLQHLYNEVAGREDLVLSAEDRLEKLELSSLGLIQLICAIEDQFDIAVSNRELAAFKTVGDVLACLEKKIGKR